MNTRKTTSREALGYGQQLFAHEGLAPGDHKERDPQVGRFGHDAAQFGVAQLLGRAGRGAPPAWPLAQSAALPPRKDCA